jgi:hypothetical protein
LEKCRGAPTPLSLIYMLIQKTKMPIGPNTIKMIKYG